MKVEQLIRALQALPLDAPVLIGCAEGGAADIARPRLRRGRLNDNGFDDYGGPHRFDEDGPVEVVEIAPGAGDVLHGADIWRQDSEELSY